MEILCFLAGILLFFTKSLYTLFFLAMALVFKARPQVLLWFLAGLSTASMHQALTADQHMPEAEVLKKAKLVGTIISIPNIQADKTQFQFSLQNLNDKPVKATLLLSCYSHYPHFKTGETWTFLAKIKRPKNLGNPGHFTFQENLFARHVHWTGYLDPKTAVRENLDQETGWKLAILMFREKLGLNLQTHMHDEEASAIVQALTLGLTHPIKPALWDLFRRTGTTHLMVISGAHISLVAGLAYWFFKQLWILYPRLCLYVPARLIAGVVALLFALCYSLLTGFAAPTERALVACFFAMAYHFLGRRFTAWQAWRYALLAILILEPHSALLPGFYLSFCAVAILMLVDQKIPYRGIKKILCLQLACLIGLMPMTLFWFSYGSLNSLLANMLAIPLVGYVLVPFSLLALLMANFVALPALMLPLQSLVHWLLAYLTWVDNFSWLNIQFQLPSILSLFALLFGLGLCFFKPSKLFLPAALLLILPAFFPYCPRPQSGEAEIRVLDVGQGLSVVIHTEKHTLVYDTGMKFFQGNDMAQMAIIPYLESKNIKKIDIVVISHPDLDHRGGLASLQEKFPGAKLLVDKPAFYKKASHNCHHYPAWTWEGVHFRFFPIHAFFRDRNNASCVLRVSTSQSSILLTGDIETLAENYLRGKYKEQLSSEFLLVAHHGSKTSSSKKFIQQIAAKYAIISAGFDNRYHFPHPKTIETLAHSGLKIFNTMDCGMVSVNLPKENHPVQAPSCYLASAN